MVSETAEFAYDLHAGMASLQVSEFDELHTIGMAATLAIHIKGLGDIEYEVLRKVSDHYLSIPSHALKGVVELLAEIEFINLFTTGKTINKITPNIPIFQSVYEGINAYADNECSLNGYEQATIKILSALYEAPKNKDSFQAKSGIDKTTFDRCVYLGSQAGILNVQEARGRKILISPYYFADNLDGLADVVASAGAPTLQSTLRKVKDNQGWPLSLVASTGEIGGVKLDKTEKALVQKLADEGIVKPPTIKFGIKSESFLFTPKPGRTRLNAANREIYERAMALIAAVRKGQLLPAAYRIRSPLRILEVLRDRGYVASNSEAKDQYQNLVVLRVASLQQTRPTMWQLRLNPTQENYSALNLAIELLRTGNLANMEVDQEARIAFSRDEQYIQSMISSKELRAKPKQIMDAQATYEYEQLLMKFT